MSEAVHNFAICLTISVFSYEMDGETKYDWWASNGAESSEFFDSIEDAKDDARSRFE